MINLLIFINQIICALQGHQWVNIGYQYYDAESGEQSYLCKRCGKLHKVWITNYL